MEVSVVVKKTKNLSHEGVGLSGAGRVGTSLGGCLDGVANNDEIHGS